MCKLKQNFIFMNELLLAVCLIYIMVVKPHGPVVSFPARRKFRDTCIELNFFIFHNFHTKFKNSDLKDKNFLYLTFL